MTEHQKNHEFRKWLKMLKRQLKQEKEMREKKIWSFYKSPARFPQ